MPFSQQLREFLRIQIGDFFGVRWQAVMLMLLVIAGCLDMVYLFTVYGKGTWYYRAPFASAHIVALLLCLLALFNVRRFLR